MLDFLSIQEHMLSIEKRVCRREESIKFNTTPSGNVIDIHLLKTCAAIKCLIIHDLNRFWYRYAFHFDLVFKCLAFNSCNSKSLTISHDRLRNHDISRITLQIAATHATHACKACYQHCRRLRMIKGIVDFATSEIIAITRGNIEVHMVALAHPTGYRKGTHRIPKSNQERSGI